ncbi:MAG: hypothetical protein JWQ11_4255 [Rhizobacter sp.]|nr:hypothetical protein [Rhizobacter sp.]
MPASRHHERQPQEIRVTEPQDNAAAPGSIIAPTGTEPVKPQVEKPQPDTQIGEEDPGAALDQPPVEPIYPPGTHGH